MRAIYLLLFYVAIYSNTLTHKNLIWQDDTKGRDVMLTWYDAKKYCQNLHLDNHNDWRLPNMQQLHELFKVSQNLQNNTKEWYWSNESDKDNPKNGMMVEFSYDNESSYRKDYFGYVRCVRFDKSL